MQGHMHLDCHIRVELEGGKKHWLPEKGGDGQYIMDRKESLKEE